MLKQLLEDNTFPSPRSVISPVVLHEAVEAAHDPVNRTAFIAARRGGGVHHHLRRGPQERRPHAAKAAHGR